MGEAPRLHLDQPALKRRILPTVTLRLQSAAPRALPATIAALLLALLVTQAASFVCTAQCIQHQLARPSTAHCHSMQQPAANRTAVGTCPSSTNNLCVADLLANSRNKTAAKSLSVYAAFRPATLFFLLTLASFTPDTRVLRSSIGDPPMITALRI